MARALVIGAGPAGLMAAEMLSQAGHSVTVAEAKPSPARKFLMAGKSGLNLTKVEPFDRFLSAYGASAPCLEPMLHAFGPDDVRAWAEGLGQPCFAGSTGRLFPQAMKASPLLRAWLARLEVQNVTLHRRWRWTGWTPDGAHRFETPGGVTEVQADTTILAMGGASWARLGSDGVWAPLLEASGIALAPFAPSNSGLHVDWSSHMTRHMGAPLKGLRLTAGNLHSRGEIVISARGLEGGGLYPLTPALRTGSPLHVDLAPDLDVPSLAARIARGGAKQSLSNRLRRAGLSPAAIALAQEWHHPLPGDPTALARRLKSLTLLKPVPRPMDEAISTAGGIRFDALTPDLMLRGRPGVFAAGEMLDWEAPTGGYLLTACLATGRWAGRAAARYLDDQP